MAIDRVKASAILDGSVTSADLDTNIAIAGNLTVDTNTLYVDSTNNRVGVGTASPTQPLHVEGGAIRSHISSATQNFIATTSGGGGFNIEPDDYSASNPVWKIRSYSNEDISVVIGGAERSRFLSSGGLTFNGDTAAANALDDYEEGTWTPTLVAVTSNPTVTYSSDTGGYYIKVGRAVHYTGTVRWSACSGGNGTAMIGGLPFAVASRTLGDNADGTSACRTIVWNGTSTYVPTMVHMKHGSANLNLMSSGYDRNTVTIQASDLGTTGYVAFTITIYTN